MESFRTEIATATGEMGREKQTVAPAVLIAGSDSGIFVEEAHGHKLLGQDSLPIDLNSAFWVASCTKLMTIVAAMQLVERGLVNLDEDITRVLHEWKDAAVLAGFDDSGKPILKPAKNKMTLSHLLTHSAGMVNDFLSPELQKYRKSQGLPPVAPRTGQTLAESTLVPLLFEPGEGWAYSCSIDWVGVMVERLSEQRLEDYMSKNIWGPLGMTSVTFRLNDRADVRSNLLELLTRDEHGHLKVSTNFFIKPYTLTYDSGGGGIYITPSDYTKLLASLLRNDEIVLKKEAADSLFTPQLPDPKWLKATIKTTPYPVSYTMLHALPKETDWNWGFGGLVNLEDIPGKRKKGTLCWGGIPNLFWWVDRTSNIYGMYATQIVPFGDAPTTDEFAHFEEAVYKDFVQG